MKLPKVCQMSRLTLLLCGLCTWAQQTQRIIPPPKNWENPERDAYQRSKHLLNWIENYLGPLLGKRIYEVGAGTGYYTWRMVQRRATVIAMDIDERLLRFMEWRRDSLGISPAQWEVRKGVPDQPLLHPGEADWVFLAGAYHHLPNRLDYLKCLHTAPPKAAILSS